MTQHKPTHTDAGPHVKPVPHNQHTETDELIEGSTLTHSAPFSQRRASPADVLRYQQVLGNRETTRLLKPIPTLSQRMGYGGIQRAFDFSKIQSPSLLEFAVLQFSQIENQDITQEEMNSLKTERQRFMPLLGRFATAPQTTLQITPASKGVTGDLAITLLYAIGDDEKRVEYDKHHNKFVEMIAQKAVKRFVVYVGLLQNYANQVPNPATSPFNTNSMGAILQAVTHELTVHAENMLDFIEDYWAYAKQDNGEPPSGLQSASAEHATFKQGKVTRYEYMSNRAKQLGNNVGTGFNARETNDRFSAH